MTPLQRATLIAAYLDEIDGTPSKYGVAGDESYPMPWQVRHEQAEKVLAACLLEQSAIDRDAPPKSQWAFRKRVRARLREGNDANGVRFGFDPFTILLIAKLILLFIELWMKCTAGERGDG